MGSTEDYLFYIVVSLVMTLIHHLINFPGQVPIAISYQYMHQNLCKSNKHTNGFEAYIFNISTTSILSIKDTDLADLKHLLLCKVMVVLQTSASISPAQLVAFSKRLSSRIEAPLSVHIESGSRLDVHPEVTIISNIKDQDSHIAIGLNGLNVEAFHSDLSWSATPGVVTILHSIVQPPSKAGCGYTIFVDTEEAYDTLPYHVKRTLNASLGSYCYLKTSENEHRLTAKERKIIDNCAVHPIFSTHPITKRRNIFANPSDTSEIIGMNKNESSYWLNFLFNHTQSQQFYIHKWKANDLLLWDNRSTQHRGSGCPPEHLRLLHRTVTLA